MSRIKPKNVRSPICATAILALLTGCFHGGVSDRYRQLTQTEGENPPERGVDVSVFTTPASGGGSPTIFNLGDTGQAAYIKALADKTQSDDALTAAVARPLAASSGNTLDRNFLRQQRTIVISVIDRNFGPADRIDRLEATFEILGDDDNSGSSFNPDATFRSWNLFQTQYETVDLGTISSTTTTSLGANLSSDLPQIAEIIELGIDGKLEASRNEEAKLNRRYVKLGGNLTPSRLTVLQEGVTGIDLAGTSQIRVTLHLGPGRPVTVTQFTPKNGERPAALSDGQWVYPFNSCPVLARVSSKARLRVVHDGASTIPEGDDVISYDVIQPEVMDAVEIFPANSSPDTYYLETSDEARLVALKPGIAGRANYVDMRFVSVGNAREFIAWLKDQDGDADEISLSDYRFAVEGGKAGFKRLTGENVQRLLDAPVVTTADSFKCSS
jgi:hypothetical protein